MTPIAQPKIALDLLETKHTQQDSLHEYLRIVGRHRYSIFALTLLFGILGALNAALEVPIFRATSTLLIDRENVRFTQSQETYGQSQQNYEYLQTQYEILKTRPLAEKVVEKIGADRVLASLNQKSKLSLASIIPWGSKDPIAPSDAGARLNAAVSIVQGSSRIDPVRNSQLVKLSFEVSDPELAAILANQLGESYIENTLDARLQMINKANTWLEVKSTDLKKNVDAAEARVLAFMVANNISADGEDRMGSENVQMLMPRVAEARADRLNRESMYQQVISARKAGQLTSIFSLVNSDGVSKPRDDLAKAQQKVSDLAGRYGAEHPKMRAAKSEEVLALKNFNASLSGAADAVVREYENARNIEQQMQSQLSSAQSSVQGGNRKSIELNRLTREFEANKLIYQKFQNQQKETDQLTDFRTTNARVVELASPAGAPISPNTKRSTIAAAALGLLLSVLLAFVLEHLDSTIKTAEDVEKHLQLPVLGLVPQLKLAKDENPMLYFLKHSKTAFSESIRTVRTGILLSTLDKQHRRILLTSSVPGEGKTTLSLNLAQAMSQMNKVLLIDADLRRPTVARAFGDGKPQFGLSQFISGEAKISECVHQLEGSNTYIMTAGIIPPNPLELLSSQKFSEALDNLGKVFDYIVIDCAPALAVSDALVLSRLVDGVIYVVRSDQTPYQAAQSGVKRLRRVDAPILGVVINRVGEHSHGYGYGRYSYYADGYQPHYGYYGENAKKTS
jgi:polysaccharide biosynthesis transport protein